MKDRVFTAKTGLFALGILSCTIYLSLIFNNNLWVDEAFTACIIRNDFLHMLDGTVSDTLPPFYNIFTWLLTSVLGYGSVVMKFSSVIPVILLALWLSPTRISGLYGEKAAALFTLCTASAPHLLHYGVEIRPYSWGLFFTTAAGVFALEILADSSKKNYGLFIAFTVLSGYTHQYALIPCAFIWLFLLAGLFFISGKKEHVLKRWGISLAVSILLYIPMLILTFYQLKRASGYFSMEGLSPASFMSDLRFPFVTNITPLSLFLLAVAAFIMITGLLRVRRNIRFAIPLCLCAVPFLTLLFGYAVSAVSDGSLFTARYLVPSLGLFWLGFSVAAADEEAPLTRIRSYGPIIILIACLIAIYPQEFREEYARGVDNMTEYFDENLKTGDGYIIYEDKYQIELCMRYYYPEFKKYDWDNASGCPGDLWYLEVKGFEDRLDEAAAHGFTPEYISDMSFDRYSFSLYKLKPAEDINPSSED